MGAASATNPHAPKHNAANTYKLSIDAAKYAADVAEVDGGTPNAGITNGRLGHHFSFTLKCLVSSLDGTGDEITDQTVTQTKIHMGAVGNESVEHRINAWDSVITTEN